MKRFFIVLLVFLAAAGLLFSGGGKEQASSKKVYEMNVATAFATGGPIYEAMLKFKEVAEAKSNGELKVNLFPGGALGGERDNLEAVSAGSLEASVGGNMVVSLYEPEYEFVAMPYLFVDQAHVRAMWGGKIGNEIKDSIRKKHNIIIPVFHNRGPRYLTANRKIVAPREAAGMKMRLPENPIFMAYWREVGVVPTPIAFPEVFTALQTGVTEAQENPYDLIFTARFQEVQKFLMKTAHIRDVYLWHFSEKWYNALPDNLKKVVNEAAAEAGKHGDQVQSSMEQNFEKELGKSMEFVEPDQNAFREIAMKVMEKNKGRWKAGILDEVLALARK